ncbi:MAG: hypothetical protein R3250_14380 [Melioribacteraceae bacterium]|nr:hypothetical protein [Melioribacteraceae bacterium]
MSNYNINIRAFYLDYFNIESNNFTERISFYEQNIDAVRHFETLDKLEIELDYLVCLFEIGKYKKFLEKVDKNIIQVISENIDRFQGKNIYNELLFKKAACLYNIGELDQALYIATELIKINPDEKLYKSFLKKCYRIKIARERQYIKTTALLILISIVFILAVEILVIREFFPDQADKVEIIRNSAFLASVGLLVFHELRFRKSFNKYIAHSLSDKG